MSNIRCKKCQGLQFVKAGFVRDNQRYKCNDCGCQFTNTPRPGVDPALKAVALVMHKRCGVSLTHIAKICGVSVPAVFKWARAAAAETSASAQPHDPMN